eukprot:5544079-Prymnesium_polylepis.1
MARGRGGEGDNPYPTKPSDYRPVESRTYISPHPARREASTRELGQLLHLRTTIHLYIVKSNTMTMTNRDSAPPRPALS